MRLSAFLTVTYAVERRGKCNGHPCCRDGNRDGTIVCNRGEWRVFATFGAGSIDREGQWTHNGAREKIR